MGGGSAPVPKWVPRIPSGTLGSRGEFLSVDGRAAEASATCCGVNLAGKWLGGGYLLCRYCPLQILFGERGSRRYRFCPGKGRARVSGLRPGTAALDNRPLPSVHS